MSKRSLIAGLILGIVIAIFIIPFGYKLAFKEMLFKEVPSPFGLEKTVSLLTDRINHKDGWHVTEVIDQEQEILKYGGSDVGKVKIIKFCNAKLSSKMLAADDRKYMSVKMPLSISVYEKSDGKVYIGLMNGYLMSRMFSGTAEGEVMESVVKDMEEIMSFLHFRYTIF
ncbi:DUF302 domain-containing protein [Galenea microaerophila]